MKTGNKENKCAMYLVAIDDACTSSKVKTVVKSKIQLSYGGQRGGLLCVGRVCWFTPESESFF